MDNKIVLYVEDEESDALLMQIAFRLEGLQAGYRTVSNGQAALDYLAGHGEFAKRDRYPLPHVVLLDLNLPEVHGFEVLKWIRAQPAFKTLPVVVFSSSMRAEDQAKARQLEANDFVPKPNSQAVLRKLVRDLKMKWLS